MNQNYLKFRLFIYKREPKDRLWIGKIVFCFTKSGSKYLQNCESHDWLIEDNLLKN